ncbi:Zinc transporter ZIP13 [Halotydeus destructor]|nr:Zinc transporter ZIP13 [Halotydeus destructor]
MYSLNTNSTASTWAMSLGAATLVGLTGILPMFIIPKQSEKHVSSLKLMLSFAVGGLLGDVFLHLLPEAWSFVERKSRKNREDTYLFLGLWVVSGMFLFVALEIMFSASKAAEASESSESKKNHKSNGSETTKKDISGYLNLFANGIDNFTHGLAVSASFLAGTKVGLLTTFAIIIHEVPHEFGDFAILMKSGFSKWEAVKAQLSTASIGLLGAVVALTADSAEALGEKTAWILPFTAGAFLHIAMVSILPDLLREDNPRESLKQLVGVASGIGVMALVNCLVH